MSSQFSYELDERQIRVMMQDAELDCNEALWNKFELLEPSLECKSSSSIKIDNYIPKFNFGISRSVIVPILFVVLIGGLSAMLFSFVDFKKKEIIDKEIPLVANPENYKIPEIKSAKVIEPVVVKATPSIATSASVAATLTVEPTKTITSVPEVAQLKTEKVSEPTKAEVEKTVIAETKKESIAQPIKKKKKKKVVIEEIPTIKAVTNLNEGASEPELDLK
ncbi:MAG: hypothetical protein U0W65_09250 [Bacteroidia bacterium]